MYYRYLFMIFTFILFGSFQLIQAYDANVAFRGGGGREFERPELNRGEELNRGDFSRDNYIPYDARGNSYRAGAGAAAVWGATRGYEAGQNNAGYQYYNPYEYYYQPYPTQQQPYQQQNNTWQQQSSTSPNQ